MRSFQLSVAISSVNESPYSLVDNDAFFVVWFTEPAQTTPNPRTGGGGGMRPKGHHHGVKGSIGSGRS